ncbi:alpha-L-fucosidase [Arthrobacter sp. GMC3]|uniref:alpha-L-fucosidase n=1 Tax=Arthrobacter sp. GMC3 TaxID=2058894 RepID=UPI0015E2E6AD|nr:alpha-L-fucosidase [Arthrobacter sp. GMC3]
MKTLTILGKPLPKGSLEIPSVPEGSSVQWLVAPKGRSKFVPVTATVGNNLVVTALMEGAQIMAVASTSDGTETARSEVLTVLPPGNNPNTEWMADAGLGISHHFLSDYINRVATDPEEEWQPDETWDDLVATFDVEHYAEDIAHAGVKFVLLTLGQNSGYFLSPNPQYDKIAGLAPGDRSPRSRDLPNEIADALHAKGIKFMAYIPANVPTRAHLGDGDYEITKRLGGVPEVDMPNPISMANWHSIIRDWSLHFGDRLDGWWIDGVFPDMWPAYETPGSSVGWASLASALKAGNPDRVITLNSGIGANTLTGTTEYDDYSPGEMNTIGPLPAAGRWADDEKTVQWFAFTYLGENDGGWGGWGNNGTNHETSSLVAWATNAISNGGAVALDVRVNRFGQIAPEQLTQLQAINDSRSTV